MIKKRRVVIALLIAGIVGVVLVVLVLLPARPGVTKANFDRIAIGMTVAEVEAILGENNVFFKPRCLAWDAEFGAAELSFDEDNHVLTKVWEDFPDNRTHWEKLLACLPGHETKVRRLRMVK